MNTGTDYRRSAYKAVWNRGKCKQVLSVQTSAHFNTASLPQYLYIIFMFLKVKRTVKSSFTWQETYSQL